MPTRVLFGPVPAAFATDRLRDVRRAGLCVTFGPGDGHDLPTPGDTWNGVVARLPRGWKPDFLALWLAGRPIPDWCWSAPVPLVGLATDWDRRWHWHVARLPHCDLVLTDPPGVRALAKAGFDRARAANLAGVGHAYFDDSPGAAAARDIDILFAGDLRPETRPERQVWAARLAALSDRRRVVVTSGESDTAYRALLRRARIAFNHSPRGTYNRRTFEALAAGALLFQDAGNVEVARLLTAGRDYVSYAADDLERQLDRYLKDEPARAAVAAAGRARSREFAFDTLWRQTADELAATLSHLRERVGWRSTPGPVDWVSYAWQPPAVLDAAAPAYVRGLTSASAADAVDHFAAAIAESPTHPLAGLALAEAYLETGKTEIAVKAARHALDLLATAAGGTDATLDLPPYCPSIPLLRAEWERAARARAGDPAAAAQAKRELLRGRLQAILAGLTGELAHYYESALATPAAPETRISLGCALARAGRLPESLPHLRRAVGERPFDVAATRALVVALTETGNAAQAEAMIERLRRLHAAAPKAVPAQDWFAPAVDRP